MQIHTPPLSGNQRQASSSPKNCHPVVTKGKERERERHEAGRRENLLGACRKNPTPTT